jgi:hypothetical protein
VVDVCDCEECEGEEHGEESQQDHHVVPLVHVFQLAGAVIERI